MFIECRHILPSGLKCQSPALRNRPFCYFHSGLRRFSSDGTSGHKEPLILPSLEDLSGIQIALMEVLSAFGHERIDRRQAAVYLNGLQLATRIAMKTSTLQNPSSVRAVTCDDQGGDLAEETTTCEPPNDCLQCTTRDSCKKFEDYEYEVEQLEEQLAEEEEEEDARKPIDIKAESAENIDINPESAPPMKNKVCHPERSVSSAEQGPASSSREKKRHGAIGKALSARPSPREGTAFSVKGTGFS